MLRIHKIEMTIIPGATGLDYSAQSITTGVTNIPYVYHAIDYQNGDTPTLSEMRQNVTCKTDSMNKVIRRTCYPLDWKAPTALLTLVPTVRTYSWKLVRRPRRSGMGLKCFWIVPNKYGHMGSVDLYLKSILSAANLNKNNKK